MRTLAKLSWLELKLFLREPSTVIFVFAFPMIVLFVLAGVFGNDPTDESFDGAGGLDYYVPAYVGVVISAIGLVGLPVHLGAYRERGILRRLRASSVPPTTVLGSQVLVGLLMAAIGALLLFGVAVATYDVDAPASLPNVIASFLVGTLSFLALGVLLATLLPSARAAQGFGLMLFFPMWLLSGAGPPRSVMTDTMRDIADFLPLTWVVKALQEPWLGLGAGGENLLLLVGTLLVAGAVSTRLLRTG